MERLYDAKLIIGNAKQGIPPIIPISHTTFWDRVQKGIYPPGFRYGSRRYWTESDVEKMINTMKVGRIES